MKRQLRDRIEQLELVAANRAPHRRFNQEEFLEAVKKVALDGFPRFRAHVVEFFKRHGAQPTENFADLGIGFHEKVHSGLDFRHEVQALLGELGVRYPMVDPTCWCSEVCFPKWSARHQSR